MMSSCPLDGLPPEAPEIAVLRAEIAALRAHVEKYEQDHAKYATGVFHVRVPNLDSDAYKLLVCALEGRKRVAELENENTELRCTIEKFGGVYL